MDIFKRVYRLIIVYIGFGPLQSMQRSEEDWDFIFVISIQLGLVILKAVLTR